MEPRSDLARFEFQRARVEVGRQSPAVSHFHRQDTQAAALCQERHPPRQGRLADAAFARDDDESFVDHFLKRGSVGLAQRNPKDQVIVLNGPVCGANQGEVGVIGLGLFHEAAAFFSGDRR